MCSLEKKAASTGPYNFHMAHTEFRNMMSLEDDLGAASGMQYRYDKRVFYKAFDLFYFFGTSAHFGNLKDWQPIYNVDGYYMYLSYYNCAPLIESIVQVFC